MLHGVYTYVWVILALNVHKSSTMKHMGYGFVWKCCVPHCTQWFCWSLSLWKMAISLGILTQHFQTNPYITIDWYTWYMFLASVAPLFSWNVQWNFRKNHWIGLWEKSQEPPRDFTGKTMVYICLYGFHGKKNPKKTNPMIISHPNFFRFNGRSRPSTPPAPETRCVALGTPPHPPLPRRPPAQRPTPGWREDAPGDGDGICRCLVVV